MPTYRRLLVPRDFSPTSERALEAALLLARESGADLHLLHVEVLHGDPAAMRAAAEQALSEDEIRDRLGSAGTLHSATERSVDAAPAVLRYADEHDIDLIVLGTHGRRGVRRMLLGSVTEEVMRRAECAVLVVQRDHRIEPVERVLVAVDFSVSSRQAARQAGALAALHNAELHAIHVTPQVPFPAFYGIDAASVTSRVSGHAARELKRFLDDAIEDDLAHEPVLDVQTGQPYRRIGDYAEKHRIDRIVMGTRGLSGLPLALLGSSTERTVRTAPCPVFITRLPEGVDPGPADY